MDGYRSTSHGDGYPSPTGDSRDDDADDPYRGAAGRRYGPAGEDRYGPAGEGRYGPVGEGRYGSVSEGRHGPAADDYRSGPAAGSYRSGAAGTYRFGSGDAHRSGWGDEDSADAQQPVPTDGYRSSAAAYRSAGSESYRSAGAEGYRSAGSGGYRSAGGEGHRSAGGDGYRSGAGGGGDGLRSSGGDGYQPPARAGRRRGKLRRKEMPLWQELPLLLVVAFCLAVLIRTFLVQAFFIPSGSMENTLLVGDRVLVNKVVYDMRDPLRGEVVVFRGTDAWAPEVTEPVSQSFAAKLGRTVGDLVGVSRPGERDFIKRVIGLPGDRVACCDEQGRITVNDVPIDEAYVEDNSPLDAPANPRQCTSRRFAEVTVPDGHPSRTSGPRARCRSRCRSAPCPRARCS